MLVVIDDYDGHSEVFRAVARSFGATLVVASDNAEGVRGHIDDIVKERVEGLLVVPRAGGGRSRVTLHEDGGIIQAAIDGTIEVTSTAQREVAGIACALSSAQLQGTETVFLVYNEDILDDEWASAALRLFRDIDGTYFAGIGQLFLIIERSAGDALDHHLESEPSVRFLVHSSGLARRKPKRVNTAEIGHIVQRAARDGLVIFLGAGFSRSSGLPLGDALRDEALGGFLGMSGVGITELAPAFHEYLRANDRLLEVEAALPLDELCRRITLERVLREELWRSGASGSPTLRHFEELNEKALRSRGASIRYIHELMAAIPGLVIVTVNFDTLVESGDVDVHRILSDEDFKSGPEYLEAYAAESRRSIPLLKLHGSIEARETIVATVDQTAQGLSTAKERCIRAILNDNSNVPWVYIGYSMRDPDAWSILQSRSFVKSVEEYWVSPFADANVRSWCSLHRQFGQESPTYWHRCITLTADKFLEELLSAWSAQNE